MSRADLHFVSAQPDEACFIWQTHVYLHSFLASGVDARRCVALFGIAPGAEPSPGLRSLIRRYPDVDIQVHTDTRDAEGRSYAPSIQPHLIVKALLAQPHLKHGPVYYHDCDIAFRRLPDFDRALREHPEACILSDTVDYIGYEYLEQACAKIRADNPDVPEDDLLRRMCDVVGIDPELVKRNQEVSGGAQYLLRGVDIEYWEKVYTDSIHLKQLFDGYTCEFFLPRPLKEYVQTWTAGMWAYLWNLWLRGHETVLHEEMDFLFSGAPASDPAPVLHMAGLPDDLKDTHFDKQAWVHYDPLELVRTQPSVFDQVPAGTVSREYVDLMFEIAGRPPPALAEPPPARFWRVLTWRTRSGVGWDLDRVEFQLESSNSELRPFESGCARAEYGVHNAFDPDAGGIWGGRPEAIPGRRPAWFVGVELDVPQVPRRIVVAQCCGEHTTRAALVQWSLDGREWRTARVARLGLDGSDRIVFYRGPAPAPRAAHWRITSRDTAAGWGWDVQRLSFLCGNTEQRGAPVSSGFALEGELPDYGAINAFEDTARYWGGRAAPDGEFYLGIRAETPVPVDRVLLEHRGADRLARSVEVECSEDGASWRTVDVFGELRPGLNDLLLLEPAPSPRWIRPQLLPGARRD